MRKKAPRPLAIVTGASKKSSKSTRTVTKNAKQAVAVSLKTKGAKNQQKLGPVTVAERRSYRAKLGSDAQWGRPTTTTAGFVWTLLNNLLLFRLEDFMPKSKSHAQPSAAEYNQNVLVAKQSLVIALDCAVTASDRSKMLTQNLLLEALAKYWSIRFRRVHNRGVHTLYDVREETARRVWRELLLAGVRADSLWKTVTEWSKTEASHNPLFWVSRRQGKKHLLGWRVHVRADSMAVRAFEGKILNDRQYRRSGERRLMLADDWRPWRRRPLHQKFCAEQPYNVVNLGANSEQVLELLEKTKVKFNVEVFRDDYRTIAKYAYRHPPSMASQWRGYRKLKAFLSSYLRLYRQTKSIGLKTVIDVDGRRERLSGHCWIRSRFFRAANRRFHASNFWPENVPGVFRDRWFGVLTDGPEDEDAKSGATPNDAHISRLFNGPSDLWLPRLARGPVPGRFINRDISSSQTQILAVFLGLPELEELATSMKFKNWLAQEVWTLHKSTSGGLLADGYSGSDDPRLVEFIKAHWMRVMYGSELQRIIRNLGMEPTTYGPGWRTSRGLWAKRIITKKEGLIKKSGVEEAQEYA
jgi:hypothetical protein